jgi:hypothetical protein
MNYCMKRLLSKEPLLICIVVRKMVHPSRKDKRQRQKRHIIPFDTVFTPDPNEGLEDNRPIESRKRRKPDRSIPWSVIKHGK